MRRKKDYLEYLENAKKYARYDHYEIDRRKFGHPAKYTKKTFRAKVIEYLESKTVGYSMQIVTLLDFCRFAGVYKDYISEHDLNCPADAPNPNDFSETIKILKTECEAWLEHGSLAGTISIPMAIFSLKNNYGWKDKTEVESKTEYTGEMRIIRPPID